MKKGTIEIQFNWIFVMIVGGLILLLSIGAASAISKGSKEGLEYDILVYLDQIIAGLETSAKTEHSIIIPDSTLLVDCATLSIKESQYEGQSLMHTILFSPGEMKQEIASYALQWEVPFKAANVLYLTSTRIRYFIVDDAGTLSEGLQDILPTNIMTSYVDIGDAIQNLNHDRIRIVMFEGDPNSLSLDLGRMKDRDVSAVVISHDPASFPEGFGTAGFFTYRGGTFQSVDTVPYVGRALLLGAVYSDDAVDYQCNIEKARLKLGYTSAILHSKADRLYAEEKLRQCDDTTGVDYANCRDRLLELKGADLDAMHMALQQEIDHCNNELKRRSCPVIY